MDRHVRPDGRVDRRAQLRLVVAPIQPQTARKIDERLPLRQRLEHRHGGVQRRQLPVRVEDVELGVTLPERRPDLRAVWKTVAVQILAVDHPLDDLPQPRTIAGEILFHADRAPLEGHDGDEVGRRHLGIDELQRVRVGTHLIRRRHRREIEIQHEQAPILIPDVAWRGR